VHSELCTCCHNVEDGQKGKQDAQIIFWKFPKVETTQRIVQCGLCQIKCAMCGYHARSADSPRQLILSPFGFSLCEICSAEFEDFLKIKQGKLEADVFWHNTEWLKLWSAWLDFQRTIMDFRNSSEFKQLQGN